MPLIINIHHPGFVTFYEMSLETERAYYHKKR